MQITGRAAVIVGTSLSGLMSALCLSRRAVVGTPMGEYLPHRPARGRVCLVGDAAHVPSPMTGRGFDASALDALALAEAMRPR
jgi:2-polyprenyl-6-methoxyphenol hydroxylase-like FAD-dependent oxidoreductase